MSKTVAIYPGSFDPITNGHLDLIKRATKLFDKVIVGILINPKKKYLFSDLQRAGLIKLALMDAGLDEKVEVETFNGLLVDLAADVGATVIIRGLRAVSDFDYEFQLAMINRKLQKRVETVFLMPGMKWIFLSSTVVREAASFGADVSDLVPKDVNRIIIEMFRKD